MKSGKLCPCCSGKPYAECCGVLHRKQGAKNAEELMRSRYSAYALGLVDYVMDTTHPLNPQYVTDRSKWSRELLFFCRNTRFEGLEILDYRDEGQSATVTFIARLRQAGQDASFQETSRFEKIDGKWLYLKAL